MFSSQAPQELQIVIDIHIYLNTFRTIYDEKNRKFSTALLGAFYMPADAVSSEFDCISRHSGTHSSINPGA
jgi:hypothetical protein